MIIVPSLHRTPASGTDERKAQVPLVRKVGVASEGSKGIPYTER